MLATPIQKIGFWIIAAVAIVAGMLVLVIYLPLHAMPKPQTHTTVIIGTSTIAVDVADTPALREQGLSGRPPLPQDSGMLFIFPEAGQWGFWMKDMHFALDIIYADDDGTISTIYQNLLPETYPQSFYPERPARYVLEVPAGYAAAHGIAVGSLMIVK